MIGTGRDWLPDFCRLPRLAAALGLAELVVLVLALAPSAQGAWSRAEFLIASGFALWLALTSAVVLCALRRPLGRLPRAVSVPLALAVPPLAAGLGAVLLRQIDLGLSLGLTAQHGDGAAFVRGAVLLGALIGAIALRYFYVQDQWRAQVDAHARAQVEALQARIRPHFLFNSMNTIASLIRRDAATAERAIEDLADLFRAALGAERGESNLAEELALVRRYLAIEQLRLGDRLQVRWELDPILPRDLAMPRLLLQPLAENAVLHGVARLAEGGEVHIAVRADRAAQGGMLRVSLRNPAPPPSRERDGQRAGHAQVSVAQRLAYRYGSRAGMTAAYDAGYYRCELWLPLS